MFEPETCSYTSKIKQIPGKERAKYTQYYMPAATYRIFFFLFFLRSFLLWHLSVPFLFSAFKDTSAYPCGFPEAIGCVRECHLREKGGFFPPGRPRQGHKLGLDREMQGSDGNSTLSFPTSFPGPNVSNESWLPKAHWVPQKHPLFPVPSSSEFWRRESGVPNQSLKKCPLEKSYHRKEHCLFSISHACTRFQLELLLP